MQLKPIKQESLRAMVVARIEELVLSGRISIGGKLPPERDLARQLGVSRPVVHEGLVELVSKGLVTMRPRFGTFVNDYRRKGSLSLLTTLLNYHSGSLESKLLRSIVELRTLFELETTRLAARNRSAEHLAELGQVVAREAAVDNANLEEVSELDFAFHHLVALASDNLIYPLLVNSFKPVYTNLSSQAFADPAVIPVTFGYHEQLLAALAARDEARAVATMRAILEHGEANLVRAIQRR